MTEYDAPWTINEEQKMRFAALFLLEYIINKPMLFSIWLERDDSDLEPILNWMQAQQWIEIKNENHYEPNLKGRQVLELFIKRYAEFVYFFDVFSGVDLGEGTFAFSQYFDFDNDADWQRHLQDERFEDMRIAVAEHLDIDAVEIVFMQFAREERFGKDATGWQFDLLLGTIWDEILNICNEATDVSELSYQDEHGEVSGKQVISDILSQGAQLLADLLHRADLELRGIPHHADTGGTKDFVVKPVKFPPSSHFDFQDYVKEKSRGDLWDEIDNL
ncbi:MAG: hypothetical protein L3J39_05930 [Verrucomicrobiales bacterium]|nr:hypothetical protein [Verrucomicrobiales bacterium]